MATTLSTYHAEIEYKVPNGEVRTLKLTFQGGPTDYYWNSGVVKDFYAKQIDREGGTILSYTTSGKKKEDS